jgi:hypothetical protein
MAVTTQETTEYAGIYTTKPPVLVPTSSWHGRIRGAYFVHDQSGAGDAGSSVALVKLPPGSVRLLLPMSWMYVNWTTASATLDLGWDAYTDLDGAAVSADPDGLIDGIDVDAVGVRAFEELMTLAGLAATGYTKLFQSKEGVVIRATSPGAIASGDDISGMFAYMQD